MPNSFDPYDHFAFLTNRVARLIANYLRPTVEAKGHHFPTSCVGILADLWSKDGVTQKELGMSLIKNKSSITKMLIDLEEGGLIYKADHPTDKRNKLIYLTPEGKQMQQIIETADRQTEADLLQGVDPADIATTKRVLSILYENLSKRQ